MFLMYHLPVAHSYRLGMYTFEECGDVINPTPGLEVGQMYTFVQSDRSNFYHPLGIDATPNTFLIGSETIEAQEFDAKFTGPSYVWASYDDFSVQVKFDDPSVQSYYFCRIHYNMEGSIQLLQNGVPVGGSLTSVADFGGYVDTRSSFDKECGSFGLEKFQLPNPLCPDRFICGIEGVSDKLRHFSKCLEAANCGMMSGMTTGVRATDDASLFVHQMIPHHQNAVNTAKSLLKMGSLLCPDLTDQTNPDCLLESILRSIVSGQNHQIQLMRKFLQDHNFPPTDNCDVFVKTVQKVDLQADANEVTGSSASSMSLYVGFGMLLLPMLF